MAITSKPMSVRAGLAYDEWITRVTTGIKELIAEGAAPAFTGLDGFLLLSERLRAAVRQSADAAANLGRDTFTVNVPFSDAEQRTLADMGASLLSFLEILTLRGKIEASPGADVNEAIVAMTP